MLKKGIEKSTTLLPLLWIYLDMRHNLNRFNIPLYTYLEICYMPSKLSLMWVASINTMKYLAIYENQDVKFVYSSWNYKGGD